MTNNNGFANPLTNKTAKINTSKQKTQYENCREPKLSVGDKSIYEVEYIGHVRMV